MSYLNQEYYCFDELLWNHIKSFILYRGCGLIGFKACENPGAKIYYRLMILGKVKFFYACLHCYSNLFCREVIEKQVYSAIRDEVSTKVVSVANLRAKIKVLSDSNLLRVLSIPSTFRNMRPLKKMRSYVLLYKIPAEKEEEQANQNNV